MIGITFDDSETVFLRELLHRYSASTFGPNAQLAYSLYADVNMAIRREE
jgi:hypothetical protein